MKYPSAWLLVCALACAAAAAATAPVAAVAAPLAQSSLLTLEATTAPAGVTLRLRRTAEQTPVVVSEFAVTIDGKSAPAPRNADGSWSVGLPGTAAPADHRLEVVVGHDGIRELLGGKIAAVNGAGRNTTGGVMGAFGTHKQVLWWILNIGIVLVAAIAISRRMS